MTVTIGKLIKVSGTNMKLRLSVAHNGRTISAVTIKHESAAALYQLALAEAFRANPDEVKIEV